MLRYGDCAYYNDEPGGLPLRWGVCVFDIRDSLQPREIAYFSPPARTDSLIDGRGLCSCLHTGSTVAFVPERGEMWVSRQETGFHVVRFTNGVWPFGSPAAPPAGLARTAVTGLSLLAAAWVARRRTGCGP